MSLHARNELGRGDCAALFQARWVWENAVTSPCDGGGSKSYKLNKANMINVDFVLIKIAAGQ